MNEANEYLLYIFDKLKKRLADKNKWQFKRGNLPLLFYKELMKWQEQYIRKGS